ncbi:MAG: helix-hairpin-helix domain-containing protein [Alphaproteobacteria bacterium]|nr:helix-hairpin-helix domain-containing protein [Alphaproteobacteria bacterium]MCB9699487.1 helix-hairpin-helix domain-containing protein [Alphaproteobacteria bacterium]
MAERLDFSRRPDAPRSSPRVNALALVLLGLALLLAWTRAWWSPVTPPGLMIEVAGDVERPGMYLVDPPTVREALRAAGARDAETAEDRVLAEGDRLEWIGGRVRVLPPSDPLLVGLPVDINTAGVDALDAIPSVSRSRAEAIVAERTLGGPFAGVDDLRRVPGIGSDSVDELRPFVDASPAPPVDLGSATAAQLERLPGIGPVLAARIVVDREENGRCVAPRDLLRVRGITETLLSDIEGRVTCGVP